MLFRSRLILDTNKMSDLGMNQTSVYLARYMGDKIGSGNEIVVSSVLLPPAAEQLEGVEEALKLSSNEVEFNKLNLKKKVVVTLTNTGSQPVTIHALQVFNHAVEASLGNKVIAPGKSVKLKIAVKKHLLERFKIRPRVLIVSDDAKEPVKVVNIIIND